MNALPTDHKTIKGYLLGQMPEEDVAEVEARLLTDRQFYEELSIVEDELIDQYLGGALAPEDRESFESHFVSSSERKQKVRFARAFKKYVSVAAEQSQSVAAEDVIDDDAPAPAKVVPPPTHFFLFQKPAFGYAIAAAILLIVGVSFFLFFKSSQAPGRVLALELSPAATTRGGGDVKEFSLTPDVGSVRLQLDLLKNEYQSYEAVLRDSSLDVVQTSKNLKPQPINGVAAVIMDVKAELLSPGDYRIQLSGTTADGRSEGVATYSYTIRTH